MAFDPTAPVLALIIEPTDDVATLRPVAVNVSGRIAEIIEGTIEAIELDGGSVLWLDESGKNLGLPTNLLATKIAHRLHAGLFPDDTINGRALIVGEGPGPRWRPRQRRRRSCNPGRPQARRCRNRVGLSHSGRTSESMSEARRSRTARMIASATSLAV